MFCDVRALVRSRKSRLGDSKLIFCDPGGSENHSQGLTSPMRSLGCGLGKKNSRSPSCKLLGESPPTSAQKTGTAVRPTRQFFSKCRTFCETISYNLRDNLLKSFTKNVKKFYKGFFSTTESFIFYP